MIQQIVILGRSEKFEKIIKLIFPNANIKIFPWRRIGKEKIDVKYKPEIIFVLGYDFASSGYTYEKYLKINIKDPIKLLNKLINNETKIVYIDTESNSSQFIFSRYLFAKKLLGYKLNKISTRLIKIQIPTIKDSGGVLVYGSFLYKQLYKIAIYFKIINSISLETLTSKIYKSTQKNFIKNLQREYEKPKGKLLQIRRSLFIDRLIRLING